MCSGMCSKIVILTLLAVFFGYFLNALVVVLNTGKITRKMSFGWRKGFMVAEVAEEDFWVCVKLCVKIYKENTKGNEEIL